jgi:hypothetical protein
MPNSYHKHGCWSTISAAEVTLANQWREPAGYLLQLVGASILVGSLVVSALRDQGERQLVMRSVEEVADPSVCNKDFPCQKDGEWHLPVKKTVARLARGRVAAEWPALAVLLVLIGIPMAWPVLLTDGEAFSSMRLVLYVLCSVFTLMLVKTGWTAETMGDIKVDPWWGTLLSSALISKAAQSFSENRSS